MADRFIRIEFDDEDGVAVWWLDQPGEQHNSLNLDALDDIGWAFEETQRLGARAVVIISAKSRSFVVGADIRMLRDIESASDAEAISRKAHDLLGRVRTSAIPVVAAIHGPALGGGLELALACSYRIATNHDVTKFALPEVQLGLLPGGGGTQLLPRLIGLQKSLELMLTGKNTYPKPARRMGLVDALIHRPGLLQAAKAAALQLSGGDREETSNRKDLQTRMLDATRITREIVYKKAAETAEKKTRGNYPAPRKIIDCVRKGMEDSLESGLEMEARYFGELAVTRESQELVRLFFAKNEAEKNPLAEQAHTVKTVAVLGAGLMGGGIAQISAENGLDVLVKDQNLDLAAQARRQIHEETGRKLKKRAITPFERDTIVERVIPVANYERFDDVELVIEAAPERIDIKHQLIQDVESNVPESCIFASNTSSIPISRLAEVSRRPEQIIGMHYFSPVPKIPLLEIIKTERTPDWVLATAFGVGLKQGKTIIVVNDGPGFYTTRILALYMNEALDILSDGGKIEYVDRAMKDFGFPIGPFELFDLVGLEVASKITDVLGDHFESRGIAPNGSAANMVDAGLEGRKSGRGFYIYDGSKKDEVNSGAYDFFGGPDRKDLDRKAVQDRLSLVMVNEAAYCLNEGILQAAQDGDVGAVFGLGFPPFRGGPFRYADAIGFQRVSERLKELRDNHGSQFEAAPPFESETSFYN